ncbi:hypothetical protein [Wenjunlia tyrosinilytica]|uniref:Uncharacterized protein n=1 Tax=Wenjunlia tyrosinilytica TaxID=1544741 RepID=A0A918A0P1_9ACTN|nr:hypothetical protein [Wenjunlia tyrosinilytica]GGP00216.1 hypothetical protein GCM10012280_68490 [Wenjunlia tyrosinilytica]
MHQLTYDPIVDSQDLSPVRLLSPLRSPAPGHALVLVPYRGPAVTVEPGDEIPSARFGTYRKVFTVDTGDRRLVLSIPLLSRDATFAFQSTVGLTCQVIDPGEIVARGIHDMSGALFGHMRRMMRGVSRHYDIAEFHEAEAALNDAVRDFPGDTAIQLRNIHVELLVDADEAATSGRKYRDVVRETRLAGMRRQRHLDMMHEHGVEGLLAEIVEREGPQAALTWIEKAEAAERAELLKTFHMVLERGDADREPFEIAEAERDVMSRVLGGSTAPFGGTRGSRFRGSLASADPDHPAGKTADPARCTTGTTREAAPHPRTALGRVVPAEPSGPPDDEPLGGTGEPPPRRYDPRLRATAPEPEPAPAPPPPPETTPKVSRVRGARPGRTSPGGEGW